MAKTDKTKYVSLGSIYRDGNKFTVKHAVKKANAGKIDRIRLQWVFDGSTKNATKDYGSVGKANGASSITIRRGSWYPATKNRLYKVQVRAIGRVLRNGKYVNKGRWSAWSTYTLKAPKAPQVTATVDEDKGEVKFSIEAPHPAKTADELSSVRYELKKSSDSVKTGTSKDEKFTAGTVDASEYTSLANGEHLTVSCTATSRGLRGYASKTASHVFAKPNPPTITSAELNGDFQTGTVVVKFTLNTNGGTVPVDTVQLWRLQSQVGTKEEAANSPDWDEVRGATDDAQVAGLTDAAADAHPVEPGTRVWYRIEATRDSLKTYSEPFECADLYVSKSSTSTGNVTVSVTGAGDGWVQLSITDTEVDDNMVRVSWSDYENAWESTDQPDDFDVDWLSDGQASVYIRGLDNGTRYWFRGRSVDFDSEGQEVLGKLSAAVEAIPSSDFGTVSVTAPVNVGIGKPLDIAWEFSSDMVQEGATVLIGEQVVATVTGAEAKATVPADLLEPHAGQSIGVVVKVTAGGNSFTSDPASVVVADSPTCTVTAATLTAQPFSFTITTDSASAPTATVSVIAQGASGSGLDGDEPQAEGDCVWSDEVSPEWSETSPYTATITAPEGLRFLDGGHYTVYATVHDSATNLDSAEASAEFEVEWAHQADMPVGSVTVDGEALSATITVNAPTGEDGGDGYVAGDRFDLYRVTVDGERKIAENMPFGTSITDRFAPFGREYDLHYLAVTRTSDGDWSPSEELSYDLPGAALRFDWGVDGSLELPFNIEDAASFEKGYEEAVALDGNTIGWWDGSARRTASLQTSLIRLKSSDEEEALSSIARYPGPVFVRTPAGAAFPANVVPSDISRSYTTREVSVSLECTEVALTDEHRPKKDDIALPEWKGGAVNEVNGVVYDSAGGFPMDDWDFLGYSGQTLYVADADTVVHDGTGAEKTGWTWDGSTLADSSGNVIPLTEVAG